MKILKGFNDWIEIFRGGRQVDSKGMEHDGDALIDRAVETFDPSAHEPPAVIGHPEQNAPAYGWVEGLKSNVKGGVKILLARFKQVVPEFEEMVRDGRFKKRSASFYKDGRLRHVGFLGAAPPAVKGLADMKFKDDGEVSFEFYDPGLGTVARIFRNLRDWLIEKEGKDKADAIIPDWDVDYIRTEADNRPPVEEQITEETIMSSAFKEKIKGLLSFIGVDMSKVPDDALPDAPPAGAQAQTFTEADLDKIRSDAEAAGKKKAEAEFAEKEKAGRKAARERSISEWSEQKKKEGKLLPAWEKMGIKDFTLALDGETEHSFAEGAKSTALDWFKTFLDEMPKVVEFKEIATRDGDAVTGNSAKKLEALIKTRMKEDKTLDYSAAFAEVQIENPDLVRSYQSEMREVA